MLVLNVGYNESAEGYSQDIDTIVRAALARGANGVVWLTLRETSDNESSHLPTRPRDRATD